MNRSRFAAGLQTEIFPMHFVFLNQYYPPDAAPTGVMLEGVVEELARQGHEVTVICAEGGYAAPSKSEKGEVRSGSADPESTIDNPRSKIRVVRIRALRFGRGTFAGKLFDYLSYYLGLAWSLLWLRPGPDRIVALTTPPYLSVLARLFSKLKGGDHAHWVMDLYPDVMMAHGMLHEGGMPCRLLNFFASWGFGGSRCAAVVTLGPDMAERVGAHVGAGPKVEWVPLWGSAGKSAPASVLLDGDEEKISQGWRLLREKRGWSDDELVVMYSGNMGLGHRFGEVCEAAKLLDAAEGTGRQKTRFVFFGDGKRKGELANFSGKHPELAFELHDYAPADSLNEHLKSADIHLVSLDGQWTGTMVPSKLQGIFEVGRPVIFVGSRKSSIGMWILESGGGWVVEPEDVRGLAAAVNEAMDTELRRQRGDAAAAFAAVRFSKQSNAASLANLFQGISS